MTAPTAAQADAIRNLIGDFLEAGVARFGSEAAFVAAVIAYGER